MSKQHRDENSKNFFDASINKSPKANKAGDIEELSINIFYQLVLFCIIRHLMLACPLCLPKEDYPEDPSDLVTCFPKKAAKKRKREERTLVCCVASGIDDSSEKWLAKKRAEDAGLLAGLLEFPSFLLNDKDAKPDRNFVKKKLSDVLDVNAVGSLREAGEVVHVFSHIRQTYVVWVVKLEDYDCDKEDEEERAWLTATELEDAAISTAMKKVWRKAVQVGQNAKRKREADDGQKAQKRSGGQKSIKNYFAAS